VKLIAGLGNPGSKYSNSRHNLGFMVVDEYVRSLGLSWRYSPDWICFYAKNDSAVFVKPSTFMNKSGVSVSALANFYNIKSDDVMVAYDDLDLPFGKVRLAINGLSAGHQGIESVIKELGSVDFGRLRVGIGRPTSHDNGKTMEVADFVLADFDQSQKKELGVVIAKCMEALSSYFADGIAATMNKFN
jgi:PTH1 family peptidyl-tRNA hydrolase